MRYPQFGTDDVSIAVFTFAGDLCRILETFEVSSKT